MTPKAPMPRTISLREQLVTVLAGAERPLSTGEIMIGLAEEGQRCDSSRTVQGGCAHGWANRYGSTCSGGCWHSRAYPQLRALERLGVISHVPRTDSSPCAHWWLKDSGTENGGADRQRLGLYLSEAGRVEPELRPCRGSGRPATPRIVSVRRALLAALNEADHPLSTDEVRQATEGRYEYTTVYAQLCRLAKLALVRHKPRFAHPVTRTALWAPVTDTESDATINAILELSE